MKRIFLISLFIIAVSCGGKEKQKENIPVVSKGEQNVQLSENTKKEKSDDEVSTKKEIKLTVDGKPHFDKMINRKFKYDDVSGDYFEITKEKDGYYLTEYYNDFKSEPYKVKLEVYKKVYLKNSDAYYYTYDVKYNKVAILDPLDISVVDRFPEPVK